MKISFAIPNQLKLLTNKVLAHYAIITFIIAMLTLIYCVYTIQIIVSQPSDEQYRQAQLQKNTKTSFDKDTIQKIKDLRTTTDNQPIVLPAGRINPFLE